MREGPVRRTWLALLAGALVLVGAAVLEAPTTHREAVPLTGQDATLLSPTQLVVGVPSCNGDPVVDRLEENPHQVAIQVTTTVTVGGSANLCVDGAHVELQEPLGERPVVDLHTGRPIPVVAFEVVTPPD